MKKLNLFTSFALATVLLGAMVLTNGCRKDEVISPELTDMSKPAKGYSSLKTDPTGYFDRINYNNSYNCEGWAFDPDVPSTSIWVHVYMDGPAGGGGTFIGAVQTLYLRTDVNAAFGISGNHGFVFSIPSQYRSGYHAFYIYSINNINGQNNPLIGGCPKSIGTLSPPPAPGLVSPGNGSTGVGQPVVFSWNGTPNTSYYRLQVSKNGDFHSNYLVYNNTTTATSLAVSGLANGTKFWWRVVATGPAGTGPYSEVRTFTTGGSTPYSGNIYATQGGIQWAWRYVGEQQSAAILLYNNSNQATPDFQILFRVSNGYTDIAAGDVTLSLQPHESRWVTRALDRSGEYPVGYYTVYCWIDIYNRVAETNESDNTFYCSAYNVWPK